MLPSHRGSRIVSSRIKMSSGGLPTVSDSSGSESGRVSRGGLLSDTGVFPWLGGCFISRLLSGLGEATVGHQATTRQGLADPPGSNSTLS